MVGKSTFGACRRLLAPDGVYISSDLGPFAQNLACRWSRSSAAAAGWSSRSRATTPEVLEHLRSRLASGAFRR